MAAKRKRQKPEDGEPPADRDSFEETARRLDCDESDDALDNAFNQLDVRHDSDEHDRSA